MNSMQNILDNFINQVMQNGIYADKTLVTKVLNDVKNIIENNKDKTPNEITELILDENITLLGNILNSNMTIPGFTVGINVGNINVKLFGGYKNFEKKPLSENALFDVASITKFYTEIVAYNLIKDGIINYNDKIYDLDTSFKNLGDLKVKDILTFTTEFRTNGRIDDMTNSKDAKECLRSATVYQKGEYNYNDIGMMIIKEVAENVTKVPFKDLVDKYITSKLNLKNTHLIVPKEKYNLITGTPNSSIGLVNDPKVLGAGGYSGHAGIFASSDDLVKLGGSVYKTDIIGDKVSDLYTPGVKDNRGIMGNTYTSHEKGVGGSFVSTLSSKKSYAVQGSTRTQLNGDMFTINRKNYVSSSTILFNPSSMSIEQAKIEEEKINEARLKENKPKLSLVKHFAFNDNGNVIEYDLIDPRQMVPCKTTINPITDKNAEMILKFMFLSEYINEYDKNYNEQINITKRVK